MITERALTVSEVAITENFTREFTDLLALTFRGLAARKKFSLGHLY